MRKIPLLIYASLIFVLTGCSVMSEDKAEQYIIKEYSNQLGEAKIISTVEIDNEYLIEWENKNDKYRGTSKVSADGEIIMIEAEIEQRQLVSYPSLVGNQLEYIKSKIARLLMNKKKDGLVVQFKVFKDDFLIWKRYNKCEILCK